MKFSELVKKKREQYELSCRLLAAMSGCSPQTILNVEKGGNCTLKAAMGIAASLRLDNIPVDKEV